MVDFSTGAVERIIHQVIDLDAITRIQLNQLQGQLLRVVINHPQLSVDVFLMKISSSGTYRDWTQSNPINI